MATGGAPLTLAPYGRLKTGTKRSRLLYDAVRLRVARTTDARPLLAPPLLSLGNRLSTYSTEENTLGIREARTFNDELDTMTSVVTVDISNATITPLAGSLSGSESSPHRITHAGDDYVIMVPINHLNNNWEYNYYAGITALVTIVTAFKEEYDIANAIFVLPQLICTRRYENGTFEKYLAFPYENEDIMALCIASASASASTSASASASASASTSTALVTYDYLNVVQPYDNMLKSIHTMHSHGLCHNDIKLENVMQSGRLIDYNSIRHCPRVYDIRTHIWWTHRTNYHEDILMHALELMGIPDDLITIYYIDAALLDWIRACQLPCIILQNSRGWEQHPITGYYRHAVHTNRYNFLCNEHTDQLPIMIGDTFTQQHGTAYGAPISMTIVDAIKLTLWANSNARHRDNQQHPDIAPWPHLETGTSLPVTVTKASRGHGHMPTLRML